MVFSVRDWTVESFTTEIQKQAQGLQPFEFCLRCATINKDAFVDQYHTFLVPDEGFSRIVKLHDRLYADKLFSQRSLDIDFIPHVGIGNSKDPLKCVEMARSWNQREFAIHGHITVLDVVTFERNIIRTAQRIWFSK